MKTKLLITVIAVFYSCCIFSQKPGNYYLESAAGGKYLDVKAAGKNHGTPLQIWKATRKANQTFKLINAGSGYFFIESMGNYIQVKNSSKAKKAAVVTGARVVRDQNKWKLKPAGNGYYYLQSKLGNYLDVQWGRSADGTPVWMWEYNGGHAQKWKLIPAKAQSLAVGGSLIQLPGGPGAAPSGNHGASTRVMTRFKPEVHGFKFSNTFHNHGFAAGIHLDFSGLCGGMTYAALDYFHTNTPVPQQSKKPNEGTQLTRFIRSRQFKSHFNQADKWVELGLNPFGSRTAEFWNWGIQGFNGGRLQELKNEIDRGNPVPMSLFAAGDGGFSSKHHQVVAIGYDMGRYKGDLKGYKNDLKIFIYDPNYPKKIMTLRPNSAKYRYYYEESKNKEWLTYFIDRRYKAARPLDPKVINQCSNINLENRKLNGQTLRERSYRCAKATGAQFRGATISGRDFNDAELNRTYFYGANCRNTNFAYSTVMGADFEGADLKNCNFSNTNVKNTRFYGADLKFIIMNNALAENANFQGADLHRGTFRGTCFKKARLYQTSLNTADCSDADFQGANLDGADLRGAILTNADFKNAIITRHTKFDNDCIRQVKNWPGVR